MEQKDFQALVNKYKEEMMQIFNTVRKDQNEEINYTDNSENKSVEHNTSHNNSENSNETADKGSITQVDSHEEVPPSYQKADNIDNNISNL